MYGNKATLKIDFTDLNKKIECRAQSFWYTESEMRHLLWMKVRDNKKLISNIRELKEKFFRSSRSEVFLKFLQNSQQNTCVGPTTVLNGDFRTDFSSGFATPCLWSTSGSCFWFLKVLQVYLHQRIDLNYETLINFASLFVSLFWLGAIHLLRVPKKLKFLTLPPCEYSSVHFGTYTPSLPIVACTNDFMWKKKKN